MQTEVKKNEVVNFWELWASYSKRNKSLLKRKFMDATGMKYQTLNSLLTRKNFNLDEQKVWENLIGLPLDFSDEKIE